MNLFSSLTRVHRVILPSLLTLILSLSSGCGVLIGNVKPVEEKAENYGVLDLAKVSPDWTRLDPSKTLADHTAAEETSPTEIADVAFQSKSTSSIISLNSACRKFPETPPQDLRTLTNLIFLGITDITLRQEEPLTIQNKPALQTTIEGKLGGESMKVRSVVLRRENCIYDLVYLARPQTFEQGVHDFSQFVASLKVK